MDQAANGQVYPPGDSGPGRQGRRVPLAGGHGLCAAGRGDGTLASLTASSTGARMAVRIRRVYEPPAPDDGYRVLIDGVWPRGVRKDAARLDEWARALAVSAPLRRWFGHDPAKWDEFRARYRAELATPERRAALAALA